MLAHGALEDPKPDAMLGVHTWPDTPAGMVGIKPGSSHASSDIIVIKVKGKGGHGAHPYRCVDPIIVSADVYKRQVHDGMWKFFFHNSNNSGSSRFRGSKR